MMMRGMTRVALMWAVAALAACTGSTSAPQTHDAPPAAAAPAKPSFVAGAPSGDVADEVRKLVESGANVVVYVGASWCEPCQAFHAALERGELDTALAGVTFVEYDADRDRSRLAAAGYDGRLIPRFALPGDDGRFGGKKIEGGIKGDGAVEHIMKRLEPLLAL